jgi:hypothetical protein
MKPRIHLRDREIARILARFGPELLDCARARRLWLAEPGSIALCAEYQAATAVLYHSLASMTLGDPEQFERRLEAIVAEAKGA